MRFWFTTSAIILSRYFLAAVLIFSAWTIGAYLYSLTRRAVNFVHR